jgi:signal transduction histidine kinase
VNTPVLNEHGEVVAIIHQVEDVTELVISSQRLVTANKRIGKDEASLRMLRQIRENDEVLAVIFDRSPSFMALTVGPDHIFDRANQRYYDVLHLDRSIVGKPVRDVFPEIERQGFLLRLDEAFRTGEAFHANDAPLRLRSNDGGERLLYIDFVYQPVRDLSGKVYGLVHHGFEVTERVLAKRSIENERENFRNLFRQTPEMVCILAGPDHVFEFVNEAHIRALGFDATGMPVRQAQPDSIEVHGILDEVYRSGKTAELHEIEVSVSNRRRYFNLTYAARRNDQGDVSGIMILGVEVTDQVLDREQIKQTSKNLEVALEARDEFLSIASHELKTPLTSLKLHHQLFQRTLRTQDNRGSIDRPPVEKLVVQSERQLNKLARLVEDMLDIARIRSGKLSIDRIPTVLSDVIREAVTRLEPVMAQAGTPVEYVCPEPVNGLLDPFRIEQVVTNLLTNAMRYGEGKPVRVSLTRSGAKALLTVQDGGRGIETEAQTRIFGRFERSISSSEVSGLGLGLFITRQIVEAHGGRVWVESAGVGRGSTFLVELPLEAGVSTHHS